MNFLGIVEAGLYAGRTSTAGSTDTGVKPISQLRFDYTVRRYHDAFDYDKSDRNYDMRSIRLRYDYDRTTTKNY